MPATSTRSASLLLRLLLTLGLIIACIGAARADRLRATLGQPLREIAHAVDVRLEGGKAVYTVRRSFANSGKRHDEASLRIELPYGAAATGLRIRARDRWYKGELLEAERAAALYEKLTGMGPHTPRDPALLAWVWCDKVHLQVFPVPAGGTSTVEYTLTVPTRYQSGQHVLFYPKHAGAANLAVPVVRVQPEAFGGRLTVDGKLRAASQPVVLRAEPVPAWLKDRKLDPSASHATSELTVRHQQLGRARKAVVALDLRHTYRGDLEVQLRTPWGSWRTLHDRKGGGKNNLKQSFEIAVPKGKTAEGSWRLLVSDHARMDTGSIDGFAVRLEGSKRKRTFAAGDTPKVIPDAPADGAHAGSASFAVEPGRISTVAARLGRAVAGPGKGFSRLEVEAAPELRPLPTAPHVVFVLDASHSIKPAGIAAQLALARSFMRHVPDGRFQLVAFRRRATPVLAGFEPAKRFDAAVVAARGAKRLEPGNGSALDAGLAVAGQQLSGKRGPRFVVMLTDALLRPSWDNRAALAKLRALGGATAHVVIPSWGESNVDETRDDRHPLAPIAARGGGVLLRIDGLPEALEVPAGNEKDLDGVTLGLVRPIRIDGFAIGDPAGRRPFKGVAGTLAEGDGLRLMIKAERPPRAVVLTGKIWARPYRRVVQVTRKASRAAAAYAFSLDMHHELSRKEMLKLARFGRVVSPVTSYLAIEPGVRPSTAGIDRSALGSGFGSGFGSGGGGASGRVGRVRPKLAPLLAAGVARCVARHRPRAGWSARLKVDTTYDEIVDVTPSSSPSPSSSTRAMRRCLVEETWRLRLTADFFKQRDRYLLTLS